MSEEEKTTNECCICFEDKTNKAQTVTKCNHNFCLKCFLKHIQKHNFCPYCRDKIFNDEEYEELYPKNEEIYPRNEEINNDWIYFQNINLDDIQPTNQYINSYVNSIMNNINDYTINNTTNERNNNNINLFGWHLNEINQLNNINLNDNT